MVRDIEVVRAWAEEILRGLGNPRRELNVARLDDVNALVLDSGLAPGTVLRLRSERAKEDRRSGVLVGLALHAVVGGSMVRLPDVLPDEEVILMLADGLQEEVLESTYGDPVPLCPGHVHPAKPQVVAGAPSWVCPHGGGVIGPILGGPTG